MVMTEERGKPFRIRGEPDVRGYIDASVPHPPGGGGEREDDGNVHRITASKLCWTSNSKKKEANSDYGCDARNYTRP